MLGGVLGEWGADEHDNIFYLGGWIASGIIVIGDVRDIAATITSGDLIGTGLNLAALLPLYGDSAKVGVIVGTFVGKHPELAKPVVGLMAGMVKYSDETTEALSVLKANYGDEVLDVLRAHGATDSTLVQLYKRDVNLFHVRKMLENVCEGGWAPKKGDTMSMAKEYHYTKHVLKKFEWGETFTKSVYLDKATTLANRRDGGVNGVELYFQEGRGTLVVYDRNANEFASVTKEGLIKTFFKPDEDYVDEKIAKNLIQLN